MLYKLRGRYPPEIDATQLQNVIRNSGLTRSIRGFRTIGGPSLDLCRSLLALRDPGLGGRLSLENVPALLSLLKFWKVMNTAPAEILNIQCFYPSLICRPPSVDMAQLAHSPSVAAHGAPKWHRTVCEAYCGLAVQRPVTKYSKHWWFVFHGINKSHSRDIWCRWPDYIWPMVSISISINRYSIWLFINYKYDSVLFSERFHSLDAKAKANPLTLEEMILMTIYSWCVVPRTNAPNTHT